MRIAIDAMGGDEAPAPIVSGALAALLADEDLHLVLVGDQPRLEPLILVPQEAMARLALLHTTDVVGMHESAAAAMRRPNSSISLCWKLLADGAVEGIISAGNTGAVVAGAFNKHTRRFLHNIQRPAIAVTMPTPTGWSVMLDVGANVHPKPEHLFQYGVMGWAFAKQLLNCESPTIGLLNVGSEASKGNLLVKQATTLFHNSPLRRSYYGNVEGRDVCRGLVDVIVCDGFVGNIVLKCCEGVVDFLMEAVGGELLGTLDKERNIAKEALLKLHARYHHSEFGGAPLLGVDGVCLICHGVSNAKAIRNAIKAAKHYHGLNKLIVTEMEAILANSKSPIPANA